MDDEYSEESRKKAQVEALSDRSKLPKTPNFAEWGVQPRKGSPFILDDFRGSNAYRKTNP
jgi:hypothetical protein